MGWKPMRRSSITRCGAASAGSRRSVRAPSAASMLSASRNRPAWQFWLRTTRVTGGDEPNQASQSTRQQPAGEADRLGHSASSPCCAWVPSHGYNNVDARSLTPSTHASPPIARAACVWHHACPCALAECFPGSALVAVDCSTTLVALRAPRAHVCWHSAWATCRFCLECG